MGNPTGKAEARVWEIRVPRAREEFVKELPTADEVVEGLENIRDDDLSDVRDSIRSLVATADEAYQNQGALKLFQDPFSSGRPSEIIARSKPVLTSSLDGMHAELELQDAEHPSVMTDETLSAEVVSAKMKGDGAIDLVLGLKDRNGQRVPEEHFVVSRKEMESLGLFKNGRLRENLEGLRLMVHQKSGSRGPTDSQTVALMVHGYQDLGTEAGNLLKLAEEKGAALGASVRHRLSRLLVKIRVVGDRAALLDTGDLENIRRTIDLVKDASSIIGEGGKIPQWMRIDLLQRLAFSEVPLHTAAGIQSVIGVD